MSGSKVMPPPSWADGSVGTGRQPTGVAQPLTHLPPLFYLPLRPSARNYLKSQQALQQQKEVCCRGNRQEVVLKWFPDGFLFIM